MSLLARRLRARVAAEENITYFVSKGSDTSTHKPRRANSADSDAPRRGVKRSFDAPDDDPSQFESVRTEAIARECVRLAATCFDVWAESGTTFSVEQKLQTDFQMGQKLLILCNYDHYVLQSLAPEIEKLYGWTYGGRGYELVGPRRMGKTFGTVAGTVSVASVAPRYKGAFINLYSGSGGQILEYTREFHSKLENDPLQRIDTVFCGVRDKYNLRIQSHMQRAELRQKRIPLPERGKYLYTMTSANSSADHMNEISSLPNKASNDAAVRSFFFSSEPLFQISALFPRTFTRYRFNRAFFFFFAI